jgi:SpoVK/Ycf46/Vps4 family AAA+-type ATPase
VRPPDLLIPAKTSQTQADLQLSESALRNSPVDSDSRQSLVAVTWPAKQAVPRPALSDEIVGSIDQLVREWKSGTTLRDRGLSPIRSALLAGPPGVGKTMTATWVAAELGFPLLTLDLSTVMSSFLGKTGNNIRAVLDYAKTFPCVPLLDEFDPLAKRRDDDTDVGELKRLVTVLLQSVDGWPDTSLLLAATNHEDLLDPAVWRRFDLVLNFDLPSAASIRRYLNLHGIEDNLSAVLSGLLQGHTFARLEKVINMARKAAVLDGVLFEDSLCRTILSQLKETLDKPNEKVLEVASLHLKGLSQREIAKRLGVAHSTVGRQIRTIFGETHGR